MNEEDKPDSPADEAQGIARQIRELEGRARSKAAAAARVARAERAALGRIENAEAVSPETDDIDAELKALRARKKEIEVKYMNRTPTRSGAMLAVAGGHITYDAVQGHYYLSGVKVTGAKRRAYAELRAAKLIDAAEHGSDRLGLTSKGEETAEAWGLTIPDDIG